MKLKVETRRRDVMIISNVDNMTALELANCFFKSGQFGKLLNEKKLKKLVVFRLMTDNGVGISKYKVKPENFTVTAFNNAFEALAKKAKDYKLSPLTQVGT